MMILYKQREKIENFTNPARPNARSPFPAKKHQNEVSKPSMSNTS
jgi:hypothetical protein